MRRSLTETFWTNVDRYQKYREISDKQIAKHLGIQLSSWRSFHTMHRSPTLKRAEELAMILQVKPIDLFESWSEPEWKQMMKGK